MEQQAKAESLLNWQRKGAGLLLPNAWDSASARLFEEAGFAAIGTTSAGIAFALGYPDGEQISREEMVQVIKRIVAAVQVPVTADIEAGYGPEAADVAKTMREVIVAGVAGVNLEDNTGDADKPLYELEAQGERIAAARQEAKLAGLSLVINARIDTYLFQVGEEAIRLKETLRRARVYLEAGADSIFVPGVIEPGLIHTLVREIPGPLNIMTMPGAPTVQELLKLGVARISIGPAAMLATMGLVREIAHELRTAGTYERIAQHAYGIGDAMRLFRSTSRDIQSQEHASGQ
ncbi:MAG: isocitrate lyase/PEP mutase family protein [Ktedonobacterales bacterium]